MEETTKRMKILIVMSYTSDYTIGQLCEYINRQYAVKHGYEFCSKVFSCDELYQMIAPKKFFGWYKVPFFLEMITSILQNGHYEGKEAEYIFWVDSDAFFIDHERRFEEFVEMAEHKNLIIAEDMHTCCLLNAGVFAFKVCEWSIGVLQDMWASTKYDDVFYYEQSALIKALQKRREGLFQIKPFHSYVEGGNKSVKIFKNVAVFPHSIFSSNSVLTREELARYFSMQNKSQTTEVILDTTNEEPVMDSSDQRIPYIYHAAGTKNKMGHIRAVIDKFHFRLPEEYGLDRIVFHLLRNTLGHYLGKEHPVLKYEEEQKKKQLLAASTENKEDTFCEDSALPLVKEGQPHEQTDIEAKLG